MHRKEIVNQEYQRHHHENDRRQERNDGRAKAGKQKLSHIGREVRRMLAKGEKGEASRRCHSDTANL
jgi:ribosomal protein L13